MFLENLWMLTWTLNKVLWKSRQPRLIHQINYYTVNSHTEKKKKKKGQWCVQCLKYSAFLKSTPQVTGCETKHSASTNQIPSLKMPSLQAVCLLSYKISGYISDTDMKTWFSTFQFIIIKRTPALIITWELTMVFSWVTRKDSVKTGRQVQGN